MYTSRMRTLCLPGPSMQDHAPAAIEWLCQTFGFEKDLVVSNEDGTIAHAQLSFGNGMIMLGSVLDNETEFGRLCSSNEAAR
jgi:uncharacterized glyoxalase superfamily protein PhnB